jgi:hypothetical protein
MSTSFFLGLSVPPISVDSVCLGQIRFTRLLSIFDYERT